jgi:enolase-phosphatase E1
VTFRLADHGIRTVVLDIEGTTTPIGFVYDVLFPFARRAFPTYIRDHLDTPGVREPLAQLRENWMNDVARGESPPAWRDDDREGRIAGISAYAEWLMDRDRKAQALKTLQGEIWARGYEDGSLRGEVYPDVPPALARWKAAGISMAIFSSGSVLAQQMLFRTTAHGDLTASFRAFFDTGLGAKTSPESYRRVATELESPSEDILFISDAPSELNAARASGFNVLLCTRPGNSLSLGAGFDAISTFDDVQ